MDLQQETDLLRKVPMFSKLDPSKLKLLAFTSQSLSFDDGEEIFHVGEPADSAYVIMHGEVDIIAETDAGEVVAGTLQRNELFGELAVERGEGRVIDARAASVHHDHTHAGPGGPPARDAEHGGDLLQTVHGFGERYFDVFVACGRFDHGSLWGRHCITGIPRSG